MRTLAMGVALFLAVKALPAQDSGIAVGSAAPGAAVETLDGAVADLSKYIGKKPALFQFWATWCSNCKALEPQLDVAINRYGKQVHFVAVAVSVNQSVDRVKAYRDKHGMKQEIVYDRKGNAADAYEVAATSYIVVVDAKGKVVYTGVGGDQNIAAALGKAGIGPPKVIEAKQ